ncbi:MAG: acyl-CoA synthetase [Panacagrimonas sp.]
MNALNAPDPTGLAEWFRRRASRAPERPALTFGDETWNYDEVQRRVERLSGVLASGGIRAGDRVAWLGFNHPMELVALFASARIGAIFVPLNFRLSATELTAIISDAGVHTLIADESHAPLADASRAGFSSQRFLLLGAARAGWESLEQKMAETPDAPPVLGRSHDIAMLMYTSGTLGQPKGVIVTHGNLWTSNLNGILVNDFTSKDITLNCAPLFHAAGLCVVALPTLMAGGHLILQPGFDALAFLSALERHRVTVTLLVPAMMLFASQHESFASVDLSSLRLIVAGGAPVPEPLLRRYNARGIPVSQAYGMTEGTSVVTSLETDRAIAELGSCGRACPLTEIRLVDGEGRVITQPQLTGEICVRGGNVSRGYWNRPAETAAAFDHDGWFRTGDAAYFDDDGFYTICDRLKDMIISGGENIYPAEVESILYEHPSIAEVAVIGATDERWGERVVAIAVLKSRATLSLEQLAEFAAPKLARYKLPRELVVIEALPRNSMGKILKTKLREQFGGGGTPVSS